MRRQERFGRLKKSVDSLSPDYRKVVILSRIEGLTIKEIAVRMNKSEGSVRNLLFRAMKELKKSLSGTESLNLGSGELSLDGDSDE